MNFQQQYDVRKLSRSVLDGTFDLKKEDQRLADLINDIKGRSKTKLKVNRYTAQKVGQQDLTPEKDLLDL